MKDYLITEEQMVDNWEKKTLSNDFMFFKVMQDEELLLELDDGVTYVVLNSKGTADDVDEKLKAFLNYLNGVVSDDEYIRKLDAAVMRGRLNKEWRLEYMTIEQRDMEHERVGRERGREEGIKTVVDLCKSLGGSSVDAVEKIVATMGFSQAEADRLVSKYWEEI